MSSPGCLTAMPSAIVCASRPTSTPTRRTSGRSARRAIATPEASPPPPTGISTVPSVGHLLGELEPDRALAGDHVLVLERRDEGRARLLDALERLGERLVEAVARRARPRRRR